MPLVDMRDMLNHAHRNGYAVGAFDVVSLDFLEAILTAAERARSPVILSLAELHFEPYDFPLVLAAAEAGARRANVPVAIQLDHSGSYESALRAINLGCNGIMVDAAHEAFPTNVALTRRVTEMAHSCGVAVEGGLGYVAATEGEDAKKEPVAIAYTSIEEARAYVGRTQVDCLAVSIGTVRGRLRGRLKLDFERLKRIHDAVDLPLAIHGGTGLSSEQCRRLIGYGVCKINYYTALSDAAAQAICGNIGNADGAGYMGLMRGVREAVGVEVERCQRAFGAAGRAAEVLARCRSWQPVEHVILYNAEGVSDEELAMMMARGREALAKIPGVRRVVTGWVAPEERARYRFCWLVELASPAVIDSYREHPLHLEFTSGRFRPIAADRITIDYHATEGVIPASAPWVSPRTAHG